MSVRIAIVGGGLSGLYAAALLEERGIRDYVLLEAQADYGGRIRSEPIPVPAATGTAAQAERFDLGATWFWPALQPELAGLIDDLQLTTIRQQEGGDMLIERSASGPPMRMPGFPSSPAAMRIAGGMAALVDALRRRLTPAYLRPGVRVMHIAVHANAMEVQGRDGAGDVQRWQADNVLLALPPRLAASTIAFTPALPDDLMRPWQHTPTWMAPHAKYLAIYDQPFWRERGLSGEARSSVGPLAEIHDASGSHGGAALFGFVGVPAQTRAVIADEALRALCRSQLARLFGDRAASPRAELLKDWAADAYTASPADRQAESDHARPPPASFASGPWRDRLVGIASEWSPEFPGYVAGAVDAARRGVAKVIGGMQ